MWFLMIFTLSCMAYLFLGGIILFKIINRNSNEPSLFVLFLSMIAWPIAAPILKIRG
jgi:hypothetical protein